MLRSVIFCSLFIFIRFFDFQSIEASEPDTIYSNTIKSVLFTRSGNLLSYPVIDLNNGEKATLQFDLLNEQEKTFYYILVHCNMYWERDSLQPIEYIDGFEVNRIKNQSASILSILPYIHYTLPIPNDDIRLKISGNYLLCIYEDEEKTKPVMQKRLFVCETKSEIQATARRATLPVYADTKQEIDAEVTLYERKVNDPENELRLLIIQNFRPDMYVEVKPKFIRGNIISYNHEEGNLFDGGNEFRHFNSKNLRVPLENIDLIDYQAPYYHFLLKPESDRTFTGYTYGQDINGKYYIDADLRNSPALMADYVYVHFTLPYDVPLIDGTVHILGAMSNWKCNEKNQMTYDFETKAYIGSMLLKQGYYNYHFALRDKLTGAIDTGFFEGNSYQTENDYVLLLYERVSGALYDRLIGRAVVNTIKPL